MPGARRLVPWVAVVAVSGCSLAISGPDPARPSGEAPRCDTGKSTVAVDGVFGTLLGVGALSALGDNQGAIAAVTGLASVAFLASAVRGNRLVNECHEAFELHATLPGLDAPDEPRSPSRLALPGGAPGAAVPAAVPSQTAPPPDDGDTDADPDDGDAAPSAAPVVTPAPAPAASHPPKRSPRASAGAWRDFWTEVP